MLRFLSSAIGASFRPKQQYLQLFFSDVTAAEQALASGPFFVKDRPLPVFPPKGKLPPRLIIKLGNVPILPRPMVERAIKNALAEHMAVVEAAPHTFKGTHFMSSRWDVVMEPTPNNPNLEKVPTIYKILNETVVTSWPGSPPLVSHVSNRMAPRTAQKGSLLSPNQAPYTLRLLQVPLTQILLQRPRVTQSPLQGVPRNPTPRERPLANPPCRKPLPPPPNHLTPRHPTMGGKSSAMDAVHDETPTQSTLDLLDSQPPSMLLIPPQHLPPHLMLPQPKLFRSESTHLT